MGTHPIFESDFDCLSDMSPIDAVIDEHEALDFARTCQDSKIFLSYDQKQSYFQNLPKTWSEPEVNYKELAKKAEHLERVDLMSEGINYRSLLLEIGTFSQNELDEMDQKVASVKQSEDAARENARQWLKNDSFNLSSSDETIKIHVETTCLPLPLHKPSSSTNEPPTPQVQPTGSNLSSPGELQRIPTTTQSWNSTTSNACGSSATTVKKEYCRESGDSILIPPL